mgnify:CR=1 FL=1
MVGEGDGGYCLFYPTAEFASYDNVWKETVKKQGNFTDAEADVYIVAYPDADPFKGYWGKFASALGSNTLNMAAATFLGLVAYH